MIRIHTKKVKTKNVVKCRCITKLTMLKKHRLPSEYLECINSVFLSEDGALILRRVTATDIVPVISVGDCVSDEFLQSNVLPIIRNAGKLLHEIKQSSTGHDKWKGLETFKI